MYDLAPPAKDLGFLQKNKSMQAGPMPLEVPATKEMPTKPSAIVSALLTQGTQEYIRPKLWR